MSYPVLYSPDETDFSHNGFGILSDCAFCQVVEEANGIFELSMQYPMDGIHCENIIDRCIIKARPNQESKEQLFRVYSIVKKMSGIVSVSAQHISYDLSGIPVSTFTAETAPDALQKLKENAVVDCPFDFQTDIGTVASFSVPVPGSIRSQLGGRQGSILDVYGGEYEFDNFTVKLHKSRGGNRGVSIRYGKNLTDINQDLNCANVATGVYPYWTDTEGNVMELPEKIVNATGTYNFVKIKMLDVTEVFSEKPTHEQIRTYAQSFVENNKIGVPSVALSVSFAQLEQTQEYKGIYLLEKVSLFDTVNVEFPALGVSATAKAVSIVYNVLLDRVEKVDIGNVRANITDTVADQQQQIAQTPTKEDVKNSTSAATNWLTNGQGYMYVRKDADGNAKDILFMDSPNVDDAVNVLRIGQSGIGFSRDGANGNYASAWTLDGAFNTDFINADLFTAHRVVSESDDKTNSIGMNGSVLTLSFKDVQSNENPEEVNAVITAIMNNSADGQPSLTMSEWIHNYEQGRLVENNRVVMTPRGFDFGIGDSKNFRILANKSSGRVGIAIYSDTAKELFWEDNGDGTSTLKGYN